MSEVEKLVERLKVVLPKMIGTLPVCPFDRRSPDYWTTANDKPCHVCGGTEEVNKCRGADLRCMDEASDAMREAASTLQSQSRRVEELEGALREIASTIRAMDDEYNLDDECDYTKINEFIEELAELAARSVLLSEGETK